MAGEEVAGALEPAVSIGGHRVLRVLKEEATYLCAGAGGRRVVLKVVDPDCLRRGQLHPAIRDRLGRVRELAHTGVANLLGVCREGEDAYLVWEYVEGVELERWALAAGRREQDLLERARELSLMVQVLHDLGIVHGQLHGRNVIVQPGGQLCLTHVSPLLYVEAADDVQAVVELLGELVERRGEVEGWLGRIVNDPAMPLAEMGAVRSRLMRAGDAGEDGESAEEAQLRERSRRLAGAAAVAGLAIVIGAVWYGVEERLEELEADVPAPAAREARTIEALEAEVQTP